MAQPKFITLVLVLATSVAFSSFAVAAKQRGKKLVEAPIETRSVNRLIIKRNYRQAFAQLQASAQNGNINAQLKLANMYRLGLGTTRDDAAAQRIYLSAASAGSKEASLILARLNAEVPQTVKAKLDGGSSKTVDIIDYIKLPKRDGGQVDWLTLAAARGDTNAVKALAATATQGESQALLAAARTGKIENISVLSASAVKPAPDALGRSPVMFAVANGNPDLLELVLHSKSDISARDKSGMSATDLAAQNCKPNLFEKLLEAGALIDGKGDNHSALPLISRNCSNWSEFKRFFAKADMNAVDAEGRSSAWYAAQKGDVSLLGWLFDQGAKFDLADMQGTTPTHIAALSKQVTSLKFILSKIENVDVPAERGTTPLMLAAYSGCDQCVDALIKKKADVMFKNIDGDTPLMFAVRGGNGQIAQNLLEAGSNGDARNKAGDTPKKMGMRLGLVALAPAN
jgi:ankyrin repeat protein